ncbi:MAG: hypothetical protein FDX18_09330 [Chlorobium sp.]|nr:MAG: hypothetical protein FDX18_09330 [Chlorobium sp.]
MSESEKGSGESLKEGMLFESHEMKGKARCLRSSFLVERLNDEKEKKERFCKSQEKMYIGFP